MQPSTPFLWLSCFIRLFLISIALQAPFVLRAAAETVTIYNEEGGDALRFGTLIGASAITVDEEGFTHYAASMTMDAREPVSTYTDDEGFLTTSYEPAGVQSTTFTFRADASRVYNEYSAPEATATTRGYTYSGQSNFYNNCLLKNATDDTAAESKIIECEMLIVGEIRHGTRVTTITEVWQTYQGDAFPWVTVTNAAESSSPTEATSAASSHRTGGLWLPILLGALGGTSVVVSNLI